MGKEFAQLNTNGKRRTQKDGKRYDRYYFFQRPLSGHNGIPKAKWHRSTTMAFGEILASKD